MQISPRVFRYSLDWRFLLPTEKAEAVTFLLEENEEFRQALAQVGMSPSRQLSFSEFRQTKISEIQSLVLPFGLPTKWVGANDRDQVEFYSSARRLIASDGYLLVGFNNIWNVHKSSRATYHASTPRRMVTQLKHAGFSSSKIFGAMPNLSIPEYIFDLHPPTIQFALQNRFRRKPSLVRALRVLSGVIGFARISHFLPCYFAVAAA